VRHPFCVPLVLLVALSLPAFPQNRDATGSNAAPSLELRIDPENLAPLVLDQKIRLMTHDGTYAEGRVLRASAVALTLRVRKSEPEGRVTRPQAELPLSTISVIHMKKSGNVAAPITLGILGGIGGFALGAVAGVSCCDDHPGILLIPLGTTIGGAVGGSLLGREMVRKTITIYLNRRDPITP
jgi:hypothetical protein